MFEVSSSISLWFGKFGNVRKLALPSLSSPACQDPHRIFLSLNPTCLWKRKAIFTDSAYATYIIKSIITPLFPGTTNSSRQTHGVTQTSCKLYGDCNCLELKELLGGCKHMLKKCIRNTLYKKVWWLLVRWWSWFTAISNLSYTELSCIYNSIGKTLPAEWHKPYTSQERDITVLSSMRSECLERLYKGVVHLHIWSTKLVKINVMED